MGERNPGKSLVFHTNHAILKNKRQVILMLPLMIMAIEDENDKAFMTWLYLQYRRLIYSEIRKVVGDGDEAEDLLQSAVE